MMRFGVRDATRRRTNSGLATSNLIFIAALNHATPGLDQLRGLAGTSGHIQP
jgi:hypothetical protein